MRNKIILVVLEAWRQSRKIKITFKPTARLEAGKLLRMNQLGIVDLEKTDKDNLTHFVGHGKWAENCNRDMVVTLCESFEDNTCVLAFADRIETGLEAVEICK